MPRFADPSLIDRWLAEPSMARAVDAMLGLDIAERLLAGAEHSWGRLVSDSNVMFDVFAT